MDTVTFVAKCVEQAGGLAEPLPDGLLEVLVPPPLRGDMGDRELARLALDPDAAVRHRDAVPALVGSQALDVFVQHALDAGRFTSAWPRVDGLKPRSIAGDVQQMLTLTARRVRLPDGVASIEYTSVAQFDFIVVLSSDEVQESLQTVVVDLWQGVPRRVLSQVAGRLEVEGAGPRAGRRAERPISEAYRTACSALTEWQQPRIAWYQKLIARRLQDEHARLGYYYEGVVADLKKRIARSEGDPERTTALRSKIEAAREEEAAKLAELLEKYRLRPSARLAAVRILAYPCLFATVWLDQRQGSRPLEVCWDPLLGRLRVPTCDECGRESTHLALDRSGRLLCTACGARGQEV